MFLRESIEHCPTCGELTPHSRRRFAALLVIGVVLLAGAAWFAWSGSEWPVVASLAFVALFLLLHDREPFSHVACERCRTKRRNALKKTKPTLDGNTEINIG